MSEDLPDAPWLAHELPDAPWVTPQAAQPKPGITADNVVRSLARGIPGMDKFAAGMDAVTHPVLGRGAEAPSIGERYHANLEHERGIDQAYDAAHPVASTVGQIAGGTAALAPLAGAAAGRTLLGMGGATLPRAMARSAASGAGMGAAGQYIENEGWGNTEGMAGQGALGGALGAVGPLAGRAVGAITNRFNGTTHAAVPPTGPHLLDAGDAGYQAARNTGLILHGQPVGDLSHNIEQDLLQRFNPQQAPETFGILHRMQAAPPGSTIDANGLMALREQLANAARNHMNPREAAAAGPAIEHLDDYLAHNIQPHHVVQGDPAAFQALYGEARGNYGAGMRSERAAEVQRHAETSAASTGSGNNANNKMRQGWNQVLRQDARGRATGLNDAELAQADEVVRGSRFGNAMRRTGNMLGAGGGLGRLVAVGAGGHFGEHLVRHAGASGIGAGVGGYVGGPEGAAIGAAAPIAGGWAARSLAERSTRRGLNTLDEMIRRRAPASAPANAAQARMNATNDTAMRGGAFGSRAAQTPIAQFLQQHFGNE